MRVCLVGDFSGPRDEGMRNVALALAEELSKSHDVLTLDVGRILAIAFWKDFRRFKPQVVHYLSGPSLKSFLVVKLLGINCRRAKTVMSATHPVPVPLAAALIPLLKPDLMLTLSAGDEETYRRLGIKTEFLPLGVNTERFSPVSLETKAGLRQKHGLTKDGFVVLHIGSIKEGRNLRALEQVQGSGGQVLIIGSTSTGMELKLKRQLEERGCLVWAEYYEHVEEIYQLADCYIFPVTDSIAAIALPLSVMEAMACNLPVVTTRFGALPRVFEEGGGLIFSDEDGLAAALEKIKGGVKVETRQKVLPLSWANMAQKLGKIYERVTGHE